MFLKESVIIEFNGLPATGKTTIAGKLISILAQHDISTRRQYVKHAWQNNGRTVFLCFDCLKLFYKLCPFSLKIRPIRNRLTHIMGEMYYFRTYRDFLRRKQAKEVLVIDQGMIQSIISIAHLDKIGDLDGLNSILDFYSNRHIRFVRIDCKLDEELSCRRIQQRPQTSARMYNLPMSDLLYAMQTQADNFRITRNLFYKFSICDDKIEIDTKKTPIENSEIIFNYLCEKGYISK